MIKQKLLDYLRDEGFSKDVLIAFSKVHREDFIDNELSLLDKHYSSYNLRQKQFKSLLKDISFNLKTGQSVAFVGATGSGKTSIINLLNRFYDIQKGKIYLDDIDIKRFDLQELRKHIGVVMKNVFIF